MEIFRLIKKSIRAIRDYGLKEFAKRFFVYFDRKLRPGKYFHIVNTVDLPSSRLQQASGGQQTVDADSKAKRKTQNAKRVLFVSGEPKNATSYYRCEIPAEQLRSQGFEVDIVHEDFVSRCTTSVLRYTFVVFYRTPINKTNEEILEIARKNEIKTIFSVDDFVYRRELVEELEYTKNLFPADRERLLSRADGMMELMKQVDAGIASTEYLAGDMRRYIDGRVFVNRNGIQQTVDSGQSIANSPSTSSGQAKHQIANKSQIENLKSQKGQESGVRSQKLVMGYFSGSETHDADLEMIWPALENILGKNENVELWLGGRLNKWMEERKILRSNLAGQIKRLPFMSREKYMQVLGQIDINLFPLVDTEFNRGKSEIKFTEAALVATPTVVSPVADMARIIRDGETGMLASSVEEWEEKIQLLIDDEDLRMRIGENVREYVNENYSVEKLGKEFAEWLKAQASS